MLADALNGAREQIVDELEHLAHAFNGSDLSSGRRQRLEGLLEELVRALRCGGVDEEALLSESTADPAVIEHDERELMRRYVIGKIENHQLEASVSETALVSEWAYNAELYRMREENRRLRALLNEVDESTAILAPGGRFLYVNRHAAQLLHDFCGVPLDRIVGRTAEELAVPDVLGLTRANEVLALARTKGKLEVGACGRTIENQFDAMYAPDGTVNAIVLVMRDVQALKLAQSRLAMLLKLGRLIGTVAQDEVGEALARVPIPELADWCAVHIIQNNRIRKTFIAQRDPAKAPLHDALLRSLSQWGRHPLWQEMLTGGLQLLSEVNDDLLRQLSVNEEQYRLVSQMGVRSLIVMPIVSRGRVTGIFTLFYTNESGRRYSREDPALVSELAFSAAGIMETARLLTELKSSEARFRIALAGAQTVVFEQDGELRYTFLYNPLLLPSINLLGKTDEQVFPPEEAARLTTIKKHVLTTGKSAVEDLELTILGVRRHYREAVEALRDRRGRIVGIVGVATDISERRRVQQQLSEALGYREHMLGILGHDLRNPINIINMLGSVLLDRHHLAPDARIHMLRIRQAADRMREMIDTLLDFTHARFLGKIPISRVPSDLFQICNDAVDELRVVWPDHNIEVEVRGDARGEWDAARMGQIISNLVGNAATHGDPQTPVCVSIDGTGERVILRVKNQGSPIPGDVLAMIFEPFRRGVPKNNSPRGLGLGLYIVQQIVLAHDGAIGVDSTAKDGTTFTLQLPRAPISPMVREGGKSAA